MSSIKQVASLAGTSIASVSRVVNENGYVSQALRERILKVMRELHYEPSANAKSLRSGESRLVGVMLPTIEVPFFGILAHAIEQKLFSAGYSAFVCSTLENEEYEKRYVNMLCSHHVDGVIVASAHGSKHHFARFTEQRIPVIAIDRPLPDVASKTISVDHEDGGRRMVEHLLSLGHKRIAVIGAPVHSEPIGKRLLGVRAGIAQAGLNLNKKQVLIGEVHTFEACYELARKALSETAGLTGLIGLTDIAAVAAMHAANDAGLNVPGQMSIIGFDDVPLAAHVIPGLTTIAQPIKEIGERAVERLRERMASPDEKFSEAQEWMQLRLIVRGSTALAPKK
jgi:LacI family transcriptional regulator